MHALRKFSSGTAVCHLFSKNESELVNQMLVHVWPLESLEMACVDCLAAAVGTLFSFISQGWNKTTMSTLALFDQTKFNMDIQHLAFWSDSKSS
jgi:hypothetical protein